MTRKYPTNQTPRFMMGEKYHILLQDFQAERVDEIPVVYAGSGPTKHIMPTDCFVYRTADPEILGFITTPSTNVVALGRTVATIKNMFVHKYTLKKNAAPRPRDSPFPTYESIVKGAGA